MRISLFVPTLSPGGTPEFLEAVGRTADENGIHALWVPEHVVLFDEYESPYPYALDGRIPAGGEVGMLDVFGALAFLASVTDRVRLGTGICLVIERDPITLAKEVASLDVISNGRLILGIGAGWNREEMENHGANYQKRWQEVREKILAMREIWTKEEAEFHGEFVDFEPIWSYPKPLQTGGPPIWIGANSKWVFDRIADYADGWMPIGGLGSGNMERLTEALAAKGRKVEDLDLALFGAPTDYDALRGRLEQGFDELIFGLPPAGADKVLPILDNLAELVTKIRG